MSYGMEAFVAALQGISRGAEYNKQSKRQQEEDARKARLAELQERSMTQGMDISQDRFEREKSLRPRDDKAWTDDREFLGKTRDFQVGQQNRTVQQQKDNEPLEKANRENALYMAQYAISDYEKLRAKNFKAEGQLEQISDMERDLKEQKYRASLNYLDAVNSGDPEKVESARAALYAANGQEAPLTKEETGRIASDKAAEQARWKEIDSIIAEKKSSPMMDPARAAALDERLDYLRNLSKNNSEQPTATAPQGFGWLEGLKKSGQVSSPTEGRKVSSFYSEDGSLVDTGTFTPEQVNRGIPRENNVTTEDPPPPVVTKDPPPVKFNTEAARSKTVTRVQDLQAIENRLNRIEELKKLLPARRRPGVRGEDTPDSLQVRQEIQNLEQEIVAIREGRRNKVSVQNNVDTIALRERINALENGLQKKAQAGYANDTSSQQMRAEVAALRKELSKYTGKR